MILPRREGSDRRPWRWAARESRLPRRVRAGIVSIIGLAVSSACSSSHDNTIDETAHENVPLVVERLDDSILWTAQDGSVELAVQIIPASPVVGRKTVALLEAVDRRGGLSSMVIVWGDEAETPSPGELVVDCTAGARTPSDDANDARDRSRETHVYAEPGEYRVTAVAIGAGCGYSNRAMIERTLTVALEAETWTSVRNTLDPLREEGPRANPDRDGAFGVRISS